MKSRCKFLFNVCGICIFYRH